MVEKISFAHFLFFSLSISFGVETYGVRRLGTLGERPESVEQEQEAWDKLSVAQTLATH